jgi:hypothetical protein
MVIADFTRGTSLDDILISIYHHHTSSYWECVHSVIIIILVRAVKFNRCWRLWHRCRIGESTHLSMAIGVFPPRVSSNVRHIIWVSHRRLEKYCIPRGRARANNLYPCYIEWGPNWAPTTRSRASCPIKINPSTCARTRIAPHPGLAKCYWNLEQTAVW